MLEPGTVMDLDGSAGRGGRLPAEIQSGAAAQPTGLREPGDFCGAELSIPSSGRASPSLRWGWTKNKQKHKLNHVPGLTHGLNQKSEPGHLRVKHKWACHTYGRFYARPNQRGAMHVQRRSENLGNYIFYSSLSFVFLQ